MPDIYLPGRVREPTKVPLSLRGGKVHITHHTGPEDDDVADIMSACADAITAATEKIASGNDAILNDQTVTDIVNAKRARDMAGKAFEAAAKRIDSARERSEQAIAKLVRDTMPPAPKDVLGEVRAGQIRELLRGMSREERMKALAESMDDDSFIGAAVSGNNLLTGMSATEKAKVVFDWRRRRHPETLARIDRLNAALDSLNGMAALFQGWALGLHDDRRADIEAAEKSAALAKEAMAGAAE